MLSAEDHDRIHAAISEAEAKTSGELFCVVARQSATYRETPFAWGAGVALALPPILLLAGFKPRALATPLEGGWVSAQGGELGHALAVGLFTYAALQGLLFAIVFAVLCIPALRVAVTLGFTKRDHVHSRALEQFAHRRHASRAPTGVLIYASIAERRVEIIADEEIHEKVGEAFWDATVKATLERIKAGAAADGLILAVRRCGQALAEHFPSDGAARKPEDDVAEV
jgi:putative membrane protein